MWVHTLLLKTVEYGVLKTHHMCCIKNLCSYQRWVVIVSKMDWGTIVLQNDNYSGKLSKFFDAVHCLAGFSKKGVTAHSVTTAVGFFSVTSSVITLSGVDFGYQNSQTLCHLPLDFFCGDFWKKEYRARTQESWRTFNITLNRLLPALTNKLFKKLHKSTVKMVVVCLEEGEGLLSICCNCMLFSTFLLPLKP
jgi:hypothetical protein